MNYDKPACCNYCHNDGTHSKLTVVQHHGLWYTACGACQMAIQYLPDRDIGFIAQVVARGAEIEHCFPFSEISMQSAEPAAGPPQG